MVKKCIHVVIVKLHLPCIYDVIKLNESEVTGVRSFVISFKMYVNVNVKMLKPGACYKYMINVT